MRAAVEHVNRNIGGYVAGNLVISLICGVVTTLSLYLLDVPYSLALGVFMAVFDIIPLVGATIGSIVVVASGLIFVDVRTAVILFVIVNVYQQIENHILQPMIYGRTVQLPSLTILVAVLCGGAVLGLVGALLAIPIAATVQAVVSELLEERADRIANAPAAGGLRCSTNQGRTTMKLASIEDVYAAQLGDLRSAEMQLIEALPAMVEAASDSKLQQAFAQHLEQTERHLERLERGHRGVARRPYPMTPARPCGDSSARPTGSSRRKAPARSRTSRSSPPPSASSTTRSRSTARPAPSPTSSTRATRAGSSARRSRKRARPTSS